MSPHRLASLRSGLLAVIAITVPAAIAATQEPRMLPSFQTQGKSSPGRMAVIPSDATLLMLDPGLRFERVIDEAVVDVPRDEQEKFKSALSSVAREAVLSRGLRLQPSGPVEQIVERSAGLEALSFRLGRGQVTDDARSLLRQLATSQPQSLILAQYMRIKEGPGGAWDPFSGAIRSSASTAELHAAVIACATGDVLWQNAVVMRKRPRPEERAFHEAVRRLFSSLADSRRRKER